MLQVETEIVMKRRWQLSNSYGNRGLRLEELR